MKSVLFLGACFALAAVVSPAIVSPAFAARTDVGTAVGPVDPVGPPRVPGTWRARVRYIDPHRGTDGMYYTYSYLDITAETQTSCEYQLSTMGSYVGIVDYCHFVPTYN